MRILKNRMANDAFQFSRREESLESSHLFRHSLLKISLAVLAFASPILEVLLAGAAPRPASRPINGALKARIQMTFEHGLPTPPGKHMRWNIPPIGMMGILFP